VVIEWWPTWHSDTKAGRNASFLVTGSLVEVAWYAHVDLGGLG
jgi:hypothetical protein